MSAIGVPAPAAEALGIEVASVGLPGNISQRRHQTYMNDPRTRSHAEAQITVHNSQAAPYDQGAGPTLREIQISETFAGDLEGESAVRALQVLREDRSASLVGIQRFRGTLAGRKGTFVLQVSGVVEHDKISATWLVVPGSGTDELSGVRGDGGFEGAFGKGSVGTLDYWFD